MRDKTRNNGKLGTCGSNRKAGAADGKAPKRTSPQHTDAERETTQMGLRILARMIARAHLRREADQATQEPQPDPGTGG